MVEFGRKIEEKVKAMRSELKENVQGTKSAGKETRTHINGLEQKEERNIQPEQKKQEFKKMRRGLGTNGTKLSIQISISWGCHKEKRKSKKLKTYLKK